MIPILGAIVYTANIFGIMLNKDEYIPLHVAGMVVGVLMMMGN